MSFSKQFVHRSCSLLPYTRVKMSSTSKLLIYYFLSQFIANSLVFKQDISLETEIIFVIAVNTVMEEMKAD